MHSAVVLLLLTGSAIAAAVALVRRSRRARRRTALLAAHAALADDRRRVDERIRDALWQAVRAAPTRPAPADGHRVVPIGLGSVDVVGATAGSPSRRVTAAPLVARLAPGVRVLGPPGLAELIAESYRRRLEDHASPRELREAIVAAGSGPTGEHTEVWIGPDGRCAARSPGQAGGRWVPVELRL